MKLTSPIHVLLVVGLTAALFLGYRWHRAERVARDARRITAFLMDSVGTTLSFPHPTDELATRDSLYWVWVATLAQLQSRRWQQAIRHTWEMKRTLIDLEDVAEFRRQGLEDPPNQLRDSLAAHPDLIPYEGVLGGTMRFDRDGIVLLTPSLAFAEFDDGHIGGVLLAEYHVVPGHVLWKRLWARRE